jgi:aspartyl-tRNA(Asn)/glutamyl-tRNA(Gln) amidotransferase subunit A
MSLHVSSVGPITRSVGDAALALSAIACFDYRDPLCLREVARNWHDDIERGVAGLRVAFVTNPGFKAELDGGQRHALDRAAGCIATAGALVEEADPGLPDIRNFFSRIWRLSLARLVSDFSIQDQERMDAELVRLVRSEPGLSAGELLAMESQRLEVAHVLACFHQRYDLILCPTVPTGPLNADAPLGDIEEVFWKRWGTWTAAFNAGRQPAITVPVAANGDGLPTAVQIVAAQHRDDLVLRAARAIEAAIGAIGVPAALVKDGNGPRAMSR